jgi:hypothetical protein
VPILNSWRPKQIANDIWRASDPDATPNQGTDWQGDDVPKLYLGWWLAYLAANYLYSTSLRLSLAAEDVGDLQTVNSVFLAGDILSVLAGVLAVLVVRRTTARQTARATRLALVAEEERRPLWQRRSTWAAIAGVAAALALQGVLWVAAWSGALDPAKGLDEATPRAPSGTAPGTIFADDFSQRGVWLVEENRSSISDYAGEEYRIYAKEADVLWASFRGLPAATPSMSVEVETTLRVGRVKTDFYGLACLGSSQGAYLFGISPDGYYTVAFDPGGDEELEFDRLTEKFGDRRFGRDHEANRLRVDCIDEHGRAVLRLYVDGVKVAETTHPSGLGDFIGVGLFAYSANGGTDVRFDDLVARELGGS